MASLTLVMILTAASAFSVRSTTVNPLGLTNSQVNIRYSPLENDQIPDELLMHKIQSAGIGNVQAVTGVAKRTSANLIDLWILSRSSNQTWATMECLKLLCWPLMNVIKGEIDLYRDDLVHRILATTTLAQTEYVVTGHLRYWPYRAQEFVDQLTDYLIASSENCLAHTKSWGVEESDDYLL